MKIGIQYCGGCNNAYQRSLAVKQLKEAFPSCDYVIGLQKTCDLMLYVCGCSRACINQPSDHYETIALTSEQDFADLHQRLRETEKKAAHAEESGKKRLAIGATASYKKHITFQDGKRFAELTGDFNPIHLDNGDAHASMFGRPVAHGILITSLLSTIMGMQLPGHGAILMKEYIHHTHPVYYGDTVTAVITLTGYEPHLNYDIAHLHGICVNQDNITVAEADYHQLLSHQLFEIQKEENYNDK